jgi:hypothetical protein
MPCNKPAPETRFVLSIPALSTAPTGRQCGTRGGVKSRRDVRISCNKTPQDGEPPAGGPGQGSNQPGRQQSLGAKDRPGLAA